MLPHPFKQDYKRVILAGLGREGLSSFEYLSGQLPDAQWVLADDKALSQLDPAWQGAAANPRVRVTTLAELPELVRELDLSDTLLCKTAGIALEHPSLKLCLEKQATLTSNTALFFDQLRAWTTPPVTIGVTGTKGKSTTTSMIYHCLKENGANALLAGNIGVPPLSLLSDPALSESAKPVVVLELSSHQLRELTVSPNIAVVQNITPEHLDYYPSLEAYIQAKSAITRFQETDDWVVFNPIYEAPSSLAAATPAKKLAFSLEKSADAVPTVFANDGWLWHADERVLQISDVPLVGAHNLLNTMPAIAIAMSIFGLSAEATATAIRSFRGLPHRLEYVTEKNAVSFYNDSQATTPEATIAALTSFPGKSIILLAGGSDKGVSFDELGTHILEHNVSNLLIFPPMGDAIALAVSNASSSSRKTPPAVTPVNSMAEAVRLAKQLATPNSVVLLSPACASFGLFKNYQDRGDQFKKAVLED